MEDLLGVETQLIFLVQKVGQASETHQTLLWKDVFESLDVSGIPRFMQEMINAVKA